MTTAFLIPDLIRDEGLRLEAYQDTRGFWTIGVGHKLSPGNWSGIRWDNKQVLDQLKTDIGTTEQALDLKIPWWKQLDDIRQDVMVNLAFNLGTAKLSTWKHTLGDIQARRFVAAEIDLEHDEPWASQVHDRAFRLAIQMETDVHQP